MVQPCGRVKGVWKVLQSFLLPKTERHYFRVFNCVISNYRVKYFRTVLRAHAASFLKKNRFLFNKQYFFILKNNQILTE